jgi:hypothetical protein
VAKLYDTVTHCEDYVILKFIKMVNKPGLILINIYFNLLSFLWYWGLEFRASGLPGRHSTIEPHSSP